MQVNNMIQSVLNPLSAVLMQLTDEQYNAACPLLKGSTIGAHTRHIIELFQCLQNGYASGFVNYDERNRNRMIETNRQLACDSINNICNVVNLANKPMLLKGIFAAGNPEPYTIETNYYRELIYNIEHAIHHMALIRVGVYAVSEIELHETFGVAASTIQYNNSCVQ